MQVRNCPICKGDGETNETFLHIMGHVPASQKVDCERCRDGRAALAKARGEQP